MYLGSYPSAVPLNQEQLAAGDKRFQRLDGFNTGPLAGFRNRLINGAMRVNQRGIITNTSAGAYTADRWIVAASASVNVNTITDNGAASYGSTHYLQVALAAALPVAGAIDVRQRLEASSIADLAG